MNTKANSRKWSWVQLNERRAAATARLLLLLLLALPAVVQEQFTYTTDNGTMTITGYTGSNVAVAIPDTINVGGVNMPVTGIEDYAFADSGLTSG